MKNLKNNLVIFIFMAAASLASFAATPMLPHINEALRKKYPYSMLTPDYGIITEFDLAEDAKTYKLTPYNPSNIRSVSYWQCTPTSSVINKYETWRDRHPIDPSTGPIITLCLLNTIVKSKDGRHTYVHRRAHPVEYCRSFVTKWKELTKNEPIVCMGGEATSIEKKTEKGITHIEHLWVWNKFRTRKGCYSYFGNCSE